MLNLPWSKNSRFGVRAGSRWPFTAEPEKDGYIHYIPFPFFLAYAAALLKKEGYDIKLIDAIAEGIDERETIEKTLAYNPGLIVIETSTPSFSSDMRIIRNIRVSLPASHIALCGPHTTVFSEQILSKYDFVNYILRGEYEYVLSDLVNHLDKNLPLSSVPGLVYRDSRKIKVNKSRPTIANLDNLPWPERESLPIFRYNDGFCNLPQPNAQMWTSRGCPFECVFCLWPQTIYGEHKYRKRNPRLVVDEMEYLINKFNFKAIYFDDDVFNIDRNHVLEICKEIKERNIKIPWAVMARADFMDAELLKILAASGLYAIKYGVESADQNVLDLCGKNMDVDKIRKMAGLTKESGIKVHLTFCLGLPGENKHSLEKTVRFIQDARPDSSQFSFATPFAGTDYFEYVKDRGWLVSRDWSDYDANYKCVVKTQELSSSDIEGAKVALTGNFNL